MICVIKSGMQYCIEHIILIEVHCTCKYEMEDWLEMLSHVIVLHVELCHAIIKSILCDISYLGRL